MMWARNGRSGDAKTTTFPNFDPPNALDVLVRRTSRLPGPGQYDSLSPVKYGKVSNSLTSMMRKDPVFWKKYILLWKCVLACRFMFYVVLLGNAV